MEEIEDRWWRRVKTDVMSEPAMFEQSLRGGSWWPTAHLSPQLPTVFLGKLAHDARHLLHLAGGARQPQHLPTREEGRINGGGHSERLARTTGHLSTIPRPRYAFSASLLEVGRERLRETSLLTARRTGRKRRDGGGTRQRQRVRHPRPVANGGAVSALPQLVHELAPEELIETIGERNSVRLLRKIDILEDSHQLAHYALQLLRRGLVANYIEKKPNTPCTAPNRFVSGSLRG